MEKEPTDYSKALEEMRHIYKQKYGVSMDDELLYMIIRMNEMQVAVNRKIDNIPHVTFSSGKDYFLYSLGKHISYLFAGIGLLLVATILIFSLMSTKKTYEVSGDGQRTSIKLANFSTAGDTTFYLLFNKKPIQRKQEKN